MIPPFLLGPLFGAAGMAVAGLAFWGWLAFIHDPNVRAAQVAEIAALTAKQEAADRARAEVAVAQADEAARVRGNERVVIRERIIRVPITSACVASPAVAAALDGLRERAGGAGAPADPAQPAALPASPAPAPRHGR